MEKCEKFTRQEFVVFAGFFSYHSKPYGLERLCRKRPGLFAVVLLDTPPHPPDLPGGPIYCTVYTIVHIWAYHPQAVIGSEQVGITWPIFYFNGMVSQDEYYCLKVINIRNDFYLPFCGYY
jgi:hypothetical protein